MSWLLLLAMSIGISTNQLIPPRDVSILGTMDIAEEFHDLCFMLHTSYGPSIVAWQNSPPSYSIME